MVGENVDSSGQSPGKKNGWRSQRNWYGLLLAALPHLLVAYLATSRWRVASSDILLPASVLLLGLTFAWHRRWPRWSGSWAGYASVLGFVFLLELTQQILPRTIPNYRLPIALEMGIWLPDAALWLLWLVASLGGVFLLARRDPPAGLLAILPVAPVFLGSLEGTSTTLPLLTAAVAATIYLRRRLYPAMVVVVLAFNLLFLLPGAYRDLLDAPFAAELSSGQVLSMMLGSLTILMIWLAPPLLSVLWQALRRRDRWQRAP